MGGTGTPVVPIVPTTPNQPGAGTSTYTLLEKEIPGIGASFDTGNANSLGNYLNIMIRLFIGICAVLAMIMIVIGGLEYMTSELVSSKEHGKERITNAIFGLLLALGSYALLNTINPDLLIVDANIPTATLMVLGDDVERTPPVAGDFATSAPMSGSVNLCTSGVSQVNTSGGSFLVCSNIASNVTNMINAAWAAGKKISGWGLRTTARQVQLRQQNCTGDISKVPPSSCNPPTAIPGTSRHESGLAVDLTCSGVSIQTRDNSCFLWLQANAGRYGLRNLSSEPWHWSTDGR